MLRLELMVQDPDRSLAFYVEVLGFSLMGGGSGTYRPLERGTTRISIQDIATLPDDHPLRTEGKVGGGVELVLEVVDLSTVYEHVAARWPIAGDLDRRPWGLRDFRVIDPDGFYWRITEVSAG